MPDQKIPLARMDNVGKPQLTPDQAAAKKLRDSLIDTIAYALRHKCKGLVKFSRDDETSHRIAAEKIVDHMELSRFLFAKMPPRAPSDAGDWGPKP